VPGDRTLGGHRRFCAAGVRAFLAGGMAPGQRLRRCRRRVSRRDPAEEDKRPQGRPPIGGAVHVRLGDLITRVDEYAARAGISRAGAVRELVGAGLAAAADSCPDDECST
jgi:hypothetical protein